MLKLTYDPITNKVSALYTNFLGEFVYTTSLKEAQITTKIEAVDSRLIREAGKIDFGKVDELLLAFRKIIGQSRALPTLSFDSAAETRNLEFENGSNLTFSLTSPIHQMPDAFDRLMKSEKYTVPGIVMAQNLSESASPDYYRSFLSGMRHLDWEFIARFA